MALTPETDQDFFKLFNGKHETYGEGKSYDIAVKWLLHGSELKVIQRRATACTVFSEHPLQFLTTGVTKHTKKGDGRGVDLGILAFLPKHERIPEGDTAEETEKIKIARGSWPEPFRVINKTAIDIVSSLAWEWKSRNPRLSISVPCDQLYLHFGCGPLTLLHKIDEFYPQPAEKDETKRIRIARLKKLETDKRLWEPRLAEMGVFLARLSG